MHGLDFGLTHRELDEIIPPRWWMWLLPWKWPRCLRYRRRKGRLDDPLPDSVVKYSQDKGWQVREDPKLAERGERGDLLIGYRGDNFYTAGGPWIVCLKCGCIMDCETGCENCAEDGDA